MNMTQNNFQNFSKIFTGIVMVLLMFVGWRVGFAGVDDEDGGDGETAVSTPTSPSTTDDTIPSQAFDSDIPVITDDGLAPAPNPHTFSGKLPEHEFETYVVERGDTPNSIADKFGINSETLLGGNPQLSQESSLLQTDVELIILPINGVLHDVLPGDSLESLATLYGIPTEEIVAYEPNNLEFPYRLEPETQILVPGAVRELFVWSPPDLSSVSSGSSFGGNPVVVGTGTYIFPVGSRNYTQFYWYGHRGLDIALSEGNAVFASDTGTVTYAGWNTWGYGNLIVVNHGNGFETLYAHLSGISVVPGQIVYQGNVIGASGNTGNSSGPHIHFEIRANGNQDNPCWYLGCG
ncbi:MAG: M23 family peptidase [Chloroflexi bacterium]|nr:MAG: M23 family peptidase [Chloroflexota bacterium]